MARPGRLWERLHVARTTRDNRVARTAAVAAVCAVAAAAVAGTAGAVPSITGADTDAWNAASPSVAYVITTTVGNGRLTWTLDGPAAGGGPGPGAPVSGSGRAPLTVGLPGLRDGTYTLTARDRDLLSPTARRTFVVDRTPPAVSIAAPTDGTVVDRGAPLVARFSCADATACTGTVADGAPLDTSNPGVGSLRVDAADGAGNTAAAVVSYRVLAPGETARVPVEAAPTPSKVVPPPTINAGRLLPRRNGVVRTTRPVLRWPRRVGARLYNVQVFRLRAGAEPAKVASLFPRTNSVRVPPKRLRGGVRYAWRVWPFMRAGYTRVPLGLSIFSVNLRRS
ncbi:MAG TPA: hypothetical protein PKD59_09110 [Miltoncostaeaceae bacterium]|nr:hypothetical protein [Miltoncostaeaceae bacterium]